MKKVIGKECIRIRTTLIGRLVLWYLKRNKCFNTKYYELSYRYRGPREVKGVIGRYDTKKEHAKAVVVYFQKKKPKFPVCPKDKAGFLPIGSIVIQALKENSEELK